MRLLTRRKNEVTQRYPDLDGLRAIPENCVLDGEVVVLDDHGRSDFALTLSREQARSPARIVALARDLPVHYMAFDLLYYRGESVMSRPLRERRALLEDLVRAAATPRLRFSEGVVGPGSTLFARAMLEGLEGLLAKRLESRYHPGRRSDEWIKIKRQQHLHCVILGYQVTGGDLRSLLLGSDLDGELTYVGKVGSGLDEESRDELLRRLLEHPRERPLLPCDGESAHWVEPEIFCVVTFLERSAAGHLRAPVFRKILES